MKLTIAELFAGVGGFRKGFEDDSNEWETVWANQWEPSASEKNQFAFKIYQERFGKSKAHSNDDISLVDKNEIPDHTVLVGGFPCQDYSVARTGAAGIQGKKGVLWWQIVDIIKAKTPSFVLLENVDRLIKSPTSQRGRDFAIMLYTLNELGYSVEWRVINAADYGQIQRRRRVFIYAFRNDTNYGIQRLSEEVNNGSEELSETENRLMQQVMQTGFFAPKFPVQKELKIKNRFMFLDLNKYKDIFEVSDFHSKMFFNSGVMSEGHIYSAEVTPNYSGEHRILKDILSKKEVDTKYFLRPEQIQKIKDLKGAKSIPRVKPNGEEYFYSEGKMSDTDSWDKPARTMLTSEGTPNRSSHIVEDFKTKEWRFITPEEAEQINGFEIGWTKHVEVSDRQRYFTMGNALVVPLITIMADSLREIIKKEK